MFTLGIALKEISTQNLLSKSITLGFEMSKRWIAAIIFGTFGRLFNNPQSIYRLEDRLANSAPIRQLARTIVALYQRGSWELKQLKGMTERQGQLGSPEDFIKKMKNVEEELKKRMSGK